jgi:hypothetical protein
MHRALIDLLYAPKSYFVQKKIIIFISDDSWLLFFSGDYVNSKGQMRGKPIHASRDVQKSV